MRLINEQLDEVEVSLMRAEDLVVRLKKTKENMKFLLNVHGADKQERLLEAVERLETTHGDSPTAGQIYREFRKLTGYTTTDRTLLTHLTKLTVEGRVVATRRNMGRNGQTTHYRINPNWKDTDAGI